MPFQKISDLPESVRNALPIAALRIFRATFNSAEKQSPGEANESRWFRIAWAAVKKKFKKENGKWTRKEQDEGRDSQMLHEFAAEIGHVYSLVRENYQDAEKYTRIKEVENILKQCNDTTDWPRTFNQIQETFVPFFSQEENLEQAHYGDFMGSMSSLMEAVSKAYRKSFKREGGSYSFIIAYFSDHIITCNYRYGGYDYDYSIDEKSYFKVPYTFNEDSQEVEFGEAEEVDILTVAVPKGTSAEAKRAAESATSSSGNSGGDSNGNISAELDENQSVHPGSKLDKKKKKKNEMRSSVSEDDDSDENEDNDSAEDQSVRYDAGGSINPIEKAKTNVRQRTDETSVDQRITKNKVVAGEENDEDDDELDQQAKTKTENGQKFTAKAFLFVPDQEKPSTWKLRIEETPGKVTVAQLGRAFAALTKGFRGNKVQISEDSKKKAMSKLRRLYRQLDAPFPGNKRNQEDFGGIDNIPDWLILSEDPPGGDLELVQCFTTPVKILKQEEDGDKKGKFIVEGIATVANIINSRNQVYPTEVWQDNLPRLNRLAQEGLLLGECDHPVDGRSTLEKTAMKYQEFWLDGDNVKFKAQVLSTEPHGKNIQVCLEAGVPVNISSRGYGTVKKGEWNGVKDVDIVQRGFQCKTFDSVALGASYGSQVTSYEIAQSQDAATEDEMDKAVADGILKQLQDMQAAQERSDKLVLTIAEKVGVSAPDPSADGNKNGNGNGSAEGNGEHTQSSSENGNSNGEGGGGNISTLHGGGEQFGWNKDSFEQMQAFLVSHRIEQLYEDARKTIAPQWANVYRKHLINQSAKTVEELEKNAPKILAMVQELVESAPKFPGNGFQVQPDKGERGPKTPRDLIEALIEDLPDESPYDPLKFGDKSAADGSMVQDYIRTPKRQARRWLQNIATTRTTSWDGPTAIRSFLMLMQGYNHQEVGDFLDQACEPGVTSVASGGAPASNVFIFPLVRRMFPMLVVNEIAAVQPMDRPEGKIFFLDHYRVEDGVSETDAAGNVSSSRVRIDRTDSLSSSYADDPGECNESKRIQLHLAAKSVTAQTKKLHSEWTIENLQDLRAYHNLDVASELVDGMARELALEWNQIVLDEMLAGAAAGNVSFGTVAPSGFTQTEWDRYIARFIFQASNNIFKHRRGDMTHIIAGADAWLRLVGIFNLAERNLQTEEAFSGLSLTPFTDGPFRGLRTLKVSFWDAVNTNKILVIRRGPVWSDVPYVWAPYIDYMSPVLTLPNVFTQKQGMMSRAAHTTVVPEGMSVVTIDVGATGTPI